jgi:hypothetical protein
VQAGTAAREEVDARWRRELRRELEAEGIDRGQELGEPDEDPEGVESQVRSDYLDLGADPGGGSVNSPSADSPVAAPPIDPDDLGDLPDPDLPSWESLPADWQERFALHRRLGQVEYQRHLGREQRESKLGRIPRRASRWADFRHPQLRAEDQP